LPPYQKRHHHILVRRKLGEQRVNLPDKAQLPVPKLRKLVCRKRAYVMMPEVYRIPTFGTLQTWPLRRKGRSNRQSSHRRAVD
jgi:hypothetical protein